MNNLAAPKSISLPILSFPEVIRAREPRVVFETRLTALLKARLKQLDIVWSPTCFKGGLHNPALPVRLLNKLESLLAFAQVVDWKLSKTSRAELDATIEDIETFNPPFRKSLIRSSAAIKAGRFATHEELEKRYGAAKQ